jgi:hypothetical protein
MKTTNQKGGDRMTIRTTIKNNGGAVWNVRISQKSSDLFFLELDGKTETDHNAFHCDRLSLYDNLQCVGLKGYEAKNLIAFFN